MNKILGEWITKGIQVAFPEYKCIFCGRECRDTAEVVCDKCKKEIAPLNETKVCIKCGRPLLNNFAKLCQDCAEMSHSFDMARAVYIYEDGVAHCVRALKYNGEKYRAKILARHMARRFNDLGWVVDVITYVPMSEEREKERGYNQARLICEEFAKLVGIPMQTLLVQPRMVNSQVELGRKQRLQNLSTAFKIISKKEVKDKKVLIIDDVYTTGATLHCCSDVLLKAGARAVFGLTFAKGILD